MPLNVKIGNSNFVSPGDTEILYFLIEYFIRHHTIDDKKCASDRVEFYRALRTAYYANFSGLKIINDEFIPLVWNALSQSTIEYYRTSNHVGSAVVKVNDSHCVKSGIDFYIFGLMYSYAAVIRFFDHAALKTALSEVYFLSGFSEKNRQAFFTLARQFMKPAKKIVKYFPAELVYSLASQQNPGRSWIRSLNRT
jgi:hypothetical protein